MLIEITNLPPDCNADDIRGLLNSLSDIETVELTQTGNPDKRIAWVCVHCSRVGADGIARKLDGRFWKNRHINAYLALFASS